MENGESELSMPFLEEYTQHYGMLHGGAIFNLGGRGLRSRGCQCRKRGKKVSYVRNEHKSTWNP